MLDSITNENGVDIETNDNILVNPGNSGGLNLIFIIKMEFGNKNKSLNKKRYFLRAFFVYP